MFGIALMISDSHMRRSTATVAVPHDPSARSIAHIQYGSSVAPETPQSLAPQLNGIDRTVSVDDDTRLMSLTGTQLSSSPDTKNVPKVPLPF